MIKDIFKSWNEERGIFQKNYVNYKNYINWRPYVYYYFGKLFWELFQSSKIFTPVW